jgi:carbohydrate esterase-like sialic acid-specific acetylesterase
LRSELDVDRFIFAPAPPRYPGHLFMVRPLPLTLALTLLTLASASAPPIVATGVPRNARLDLFLLAGQSNMSGRGVVGTLDRIAYPRVMSLDRSLHWRTAIDPIHWDKRFAGVGPGRSFGLAYAAEDTAVVVGLIPAAVGATSISVWEPGSVDTATSTHPYDDALRRARIAMRDGSLRAILWHQGEADATPVRSTLYDHRLRALIARFRSDLATPDLPFLIGGLGHFPDVRWDADMQRVDSVHRAIAATVPNVAYVSADGLSDATRVGHFDARSQHELGARYATAYRKLLARDPRRIEHDALHTFALPP